MLLFKSVIIGEKRYLKEERWKEDSLKKTKKNSPLIVCLGDFREIKRVKTHEKEEAFTTMSSSNASFPGSETLLDFVQPFDVTVLDAVVNAFYSPGGIRNYERKPSKS